MRPMTTQGHLWLVGCWVMNAVGLQPYDGGGPVHSGNPRCGEGLQLGAGGCPGLNDALQLGDLCIVSLGCTLVVF